MIFQDTNNNIASFTIIETLIMNCDNIAIKYFWDIIEVNTVFLDIDLAFLFIPFITHTMIVHTNCIYVNRLKIMVIPSHFNHFEHTPSLPHIYWLGGSPCAGKSSVAQQIAQRFGIERYSVDDAFSAHLARFDRDRHPTLTRWLGATWDERWMQPPEALLAEAIACYSEHFSLILEDIFKLPSGVPVLVEGTAILPALAARWIGAPRQALWMVPTPTFQREHYARRPWARQTVSDCRDPETAFENWMERDIRFGAWVRQETARLGLTTLVVDGQRSLEENMCWVAEFFGFGCAGG